jgi:hypothetical protein
MLVNSVTREVTLKILTIILLLFSFRVVSQYLQLNADITFLPEFDAWHSASIPYPFLLCSQLIIIFLSGTVILKIYKCSYRANAKRATILMWLGWLYFILMMIRFLLSTTVLQSHVWFGATLPAFFHMVLASFLIALGSYEKAELDSMENSRES